MRGRYLFGYYVFAVFCLVLARSAGVEVTRFIGENTGGAGLYTAVSLTLVVPVVLVTIVLRVIIRRSLQFRRPN